MSDQERKFLDRLKTGYDRSDKMLKPFREQRRANIEGYVGPNYGNGDNIKARPLNMIYMQEETVRAHVVARNPSPDITTYDRSMRPFAYSLEQVMEWLFEEMDLSRTLGRAFVDAYMGIGVLKIGQDKGLSRPFMRGHMAMRPFAEPVSLDDLILDPDARRGDARLFAGDKYEVPLQYAQDVWPEYADRLKHDYEIEQEAAKYLTRDKSTETLYEMCQVADIWLAPGNPVAGDKGVIITVPIVGPFVIMESIESDEDGPYEFLGMSEVPDNQMPLAPITALAALDELINASGRKLQRQMERSKTILAVERSGEEDAKKVIKTNDGQAVVVDNIDRMKEVTFGGADEKTYVMTQFLMQMFSRQGGNTNLLGGLASDARTATEAVMLGQNSQASVTGMQDQLYKLAKRVMRRIGHMVMADTGIDVQLLPKVPAILQPYIDPMQFNREYRGLYGGDMRDYFFDVQPHSMEPLDPQKRVENMLMLVREIILPTMQASAAQGRALDIPALIDIVGKELHVKEMDEIYPATEIPTGMGMLPEATSGVQPMGGIAPAGKKAGLSVNVSASKGGIPSMPQPTRQPAGSVV